LSATASLRPKQTSVLVVSGICLWFILNRRFSELLLVSALSGALYLATFLIGGQNYFYAVVKSQANCGFHLLLGVDNLVRLSEISSSAARTSRLECCSPVAPS
jgi:hypothetical protein